MQALLSYMSAQIHARCTMNTSLSITCRSWYTLPVLPSALCYQRIIGQEADYFRSSVCPRRPDILLQHTTTHLKPPSLPPPLQPPQQLILQHQSPHPPPQPSILPPQSLILPLQLPTFLLPHLQFIDFGSELMVRVKQMSIQDFESGF